MNDARPDLSEYKQMRFSTSGEVDGSIADRFLNIANQFADEVKQSRDDPSLEGFDFEICYIPIVMKSDEHNWYPARTKISHKDRILYACPILDYSVFADGSDDDAFCEYGRGLRGELSHLAMFSVPSEQISEISSFFELVEANLASKNSEPQ